MRIERMNAAHLDGAERIEKECFSHPWSRKSLEEELENDTSLFLAATENGEVIGYIGMSMVIDEGYLFNVAVDSRRRKQGVGTALVRELVTYCQKHSFAFLTLEVRESNLPAIRLYSSFGFVKAGERKNYYSDPAENAWLMTKYF